MQKITNGSYTGERALFKSKDLEIANSVFFDGESPLKESKNIKLLNCEFKWKYPLWYSNDIKVENSVLHETARSGIWYTHNIEIINSNIIAPKTFRRASNISLHNVEMPNALETFWNCKNIKLKNVKAKGDYFIFNSENIKVENLDLLGNYCFDGCKNIEINKSNLISKDSFWNCENVIVYNSYINGEYLGWNSKNVTFINCTIESLQGMCYMENITMKDCKLINTTLAFEYSSCDVELIGDVDSIVNPKSGTIKADKIKEIIINEFKDEESDCKVITKE